MRLPAFLVTGLAASPPLLTRTVTRTCAPALSTSSDGSDVELQLRELLSEAQSQQGPQPSMKMIGSIRRRLRRRKDAATLIDLADSVQAEDEVEQNRLVDEAEEKRLADEAEEKRRADEAEGNH